MLGKPKRPTFSSAELELHLQQITLDSSSTGTENVEALAPLIRSIQETDSEQVYLRSLDKLVEEKEKEIGKVVEDNYEDFVESVSTLLTVRQGTVHLRKRIGELDGQMGDVGRALGEKKRALLHQRKIAKNLDDAIETLQTCLRVLDLVSRVGDMIRDQKYWGALRSLESILLLPPPQIAPTPFYLHLLSSLPSLRQSIKSSVSASCKSWLFDVREAGAKVGRLALDQMQLRIKRWRAKREKDGGARLAQVGGALESVSWERVEFNALDNDEIKVDFRPLLQCIHIYEALECKAELQRSYQEDRKTQAALILTQRQSTPSSILNNLPLLMAELVGFFMIESHVLRTCPSFRSERDVDDLWNNMCERIVGIVGDGLKGCEEPEVFLGTKSEVLGFVQTLEGHGYDITALNSLLLTLFERYSELLYRKFSADFNQIVMDDDNQPMMINDQEEFDQVVGVCWLATGEAESLAMEGFPQPMPFSQTYPMCCINVRNFVDQFYQFVDGVSQHHLDIDEVLRKSLDGLLTDNVSRNIGERLKTMSNLSQIAQVVINLEHFATACDELEGVMMNLRASQRGGQIHLSSLQAFNGTLALAQSRIDAVIASKLESFFELAEYEWMPVRAQSDSEPSTYVFEMITFLTAYVDSVLIHLREEIKERAYRNALTNVSESLLNMLCGREVQRFNEPALANVLADVRFIETEVKRMGKASLDNVFTEIKLTLGIVLSDAVSAYMEPSIRSLSYSAVKPSRLSAILAKLGRLPPPGTRQSMQLVERSQRRRQEAEQVARLR